MSPTFVVKNYFVILYYCYLVYEIFLFHILASIGVVGILVVVLFIFLIWGATLSIIADKAGVKNGWRAWIPVLNLFLEFEIAGIQLRYAFLWLALIIFLFSIQFLGQVGLFIGYILNIYLWMRISEALGKNPLLGLLYIFPPLGIGLQMYLAYAKVVSPKMATTASEAALQSKIKSYPVDMGIFNFIKNGIASGKSKEVIFTSIMDSHISAAQFEAAYALAEKEQPREAPTPQSHNAK